MNDLVLNEIARVAQQFDVDRVLLYGSRARGDHSLASDYDVAIFGDHLSAVDKVLLSNAVDEIRTLKKIDLVFMADNRDDDFARRILAEGVVIYEQARDQTC